MWYSLTQTPIQLAKKKKKKSMLSLNFFALNTPCKAIYFTNNTCKQEQNCLVSSRILITATALLTKKKTKMYRQLQRWFFHMLLVLFISTSVHQLIQL